MKERYHDVRRARRAMMGRRVVRKGEMAAQVDARVPVGVRRRMPMVGGAGGG